MVLFKTSMAAFVSRVFRRTTIAKGSPSAPPPGRASRETKTSSAVQAPFLIFLFLSQAIYSFDTRLYSPSLQDIGLAASAARPTTTDRWYSTTRPEHPA